MWFVITQIWPYLLAAFASAYGVYNTAFGIAWFAGSSTMGWLYDHSIVALVLFGVAAQAASILIFLTQAERGQRDN